MNTRKLSMIALLLMAATQGAVAQSYPVIVKHGVEEAGKWTADPNPASSDQTVTVTYNGTLKVKSLEANTVTPTDLSMVDNAGNARTSMTTANCYMVHTAGDYKLPLVYGNAIKNGAPNTAAGISGDKTKVTYYVNHTGAYVYAPWITKSTTGTGVNQGLGLTVKSAELLWQDAPGLVTEVGIDGDYLTLTVGKDATEQEGNAVVAVRDDYGKIAWSWHIWLTKQTFAAADLTTVATGSHTYKVAPVNVGWVGTPFGKGYSTYYQWGRKDAFLPADIDVVDMEKPAAKPVNTGSSSGSSSGSGTPVHIVVDVTWEPFKEYKPTFSNNHIAYNINGQEITGITTVESDPNNLNTARSGLTQNPTKLIYNSKYGFSYNGYWNATQTESSTNVTTATVKTIYDPCPPGFCVPTDNLFNYFASLGVSKLPWDEERKGRIYTVTSETAITPTMFLPAMGKRDYREGVIDAGIRGAYWSATAFVDDKNKEKAHVFFMTDNGLAYFTNLERGTGNPVRAVAEE